MAALVLNHIVRVGQGNYLTEIAALIGQGFQVFVVLARSNSLPFVGGQASTRTLYPLERE